MSLLSVPLRVVLPWWCDATSGYTPDIGWAICNGQTLDASHQDVVAGTSFTLPDLRNRFVLGADPTKGDGVAGVALNSGSINAAAGAPGAKGTGGVNVINNTSGGGGGGNWNHRHLVRSFNGVLNWWETPDGVPGPFNQQTLDTVLTSSSNSEAQHNWTGPNITTPSDNKEENRPLYYGLVYIMHVKY